MVAIDCILVSENLSSMRPALSLVIALLLFNSTIAQDHSLFGEKVPELTGRLIGYEQVKHNDITVKFTFLSPNNGREAQTDLIAEIQADGSFSIDLKYPLRYRQAWFRLGKHFYAQVIVDKGLHVEIDILKITKKNAYWYSPFVKWNGPDSELNYLVNDWTKYRQSNVPKSLKPSSFIMDRAKPAAVRAKLYRDASQKELAIMQKYLLKNPSDWGWFIKSQYESNMYGWLTSNYWGEGLPEHLSSELQEHNPVSISNETIMSFYGYWSAAVGMAAKKDKIARLLYLSPLINDDDKDKFDLVVAYAKNEITKNEEPDIGKKLSEIHLDYVEELYEHDVDLFLKNITDLSGETKDMLLATAVPEDLEKKPIYFQKVLPLIENVVIKELVQDEWNSVKRTLAESNKRLAELSVEGLETSLGKQVGKTSASNLYIANHESLDDLLGAIKAAYPKKHIVLDIWAVWCGPCIDDMRKSRPNLKKLDDRNVEVVYLCSSSSTNKKAWKRKVAELNVPKDQILLNENLSNEIMQFFDLNGFPSHVFIDQSGKVKKDMLHHINGINFDKLDARLNRLK